MNVKRIHPPRVHYKHTKRPGLSVFGRLVGSYIELCTGIAEVVGWNPVKVFFSGSLLETV